MTRRPRPLAVVLAVVLGGLALTAGVLGCSGRGKPAASNIAVPAGGCSAPVQERLDPRSTIHLFPGAPEPSYLSDPPTSGPHRPGLPYTGVLSAAIPRASQVAMLESGYILIQAQGLSRADQGRIDALTGTLVSVAPPVSRLATPVVVTAWTWKLYCAGVTPTSLQAMRNFIGAHIGVGSSGGHPEPQVTVPSATTLP